MGFSLGLSASHSKSKSKSTSDNTIDPVSLGLFQGDHAAALAQLGLVQNTPYGGQLGAGLDAQQVQASQMAQANAGVGQDQVNNASHIAEGVGAYAPGSVTAGSLNGMDLSGYMNPYLDQVADQGLAKLDGFYGQALVRNAQEAGPGAWGGDRHGVADSLTAGNFIDQAGSFLTNLYQGGYDRATGLAQDDIANQLGADQFNVNSSLAGQNLNLSGANALAGYGVTANTLGANDASLINDFGTQAQTTAENQQQLAYQEWLRQQGLPIELAQAYAGLAGQVPIVVDNKSTGKNTGTNIGATASASYGKKG